MKKRIFKLLLVVLALSLFATTLLAACQHSEVYYLSKGSDFTVYQKESDVPENVRLTKGENNVYTYEADFAQGDQFVVYNVGSDVNVVTSVFSSEQHLTLADGKVSVADAGHYALSLDVAKGELTYVYTAPAPSAPTVQSVQLTAKVGTLKVGETSKFVAKVTMSDTTTNGNVTWQSTNQQVATVDADGTVHALAEGTTVISATAGGVSDSVQLTVTQATTPTVPVTAIELSGDEIADGELYLYISDEPVTVNVAVAPANATNKAYSYQLRGTDGVVQVSALPNGGGYTVTPLKVGEVTLVVTSDENSEIKAECAITVEYAPIENLVLNPTTIGGDSDKFFVGSEQTVAVTITPAGANQEYTFELQNNDEVVEAVKVAEGVKITANKAGTATLVVKAAADEQVTANCVITVNDLEVTKIVMLDKLTLEKGSQQKLETTLEPAGVEDELAWSVSPQNIVSVDTDGTVHALAEGVATVTAKASNGVEANCVVTVPKHVTGLTVATSITVYTGDGAKERDLAVAVIPSDATNKEFTVSVEQEEEFISYVIGDGKVTIKGLKVGEATLSIKSVDNEEVSKNCTVNVKDVAEAVPYLSAGGRVDIMLGDTSSEIEILSDYGEITSISLPSNDYVELVDKSGDGTFKFTITGKKLGGGSATITVYVEEQEKTVTLSFRVAAEYFMLVGVVEGKTNWQDVTKATAETNNTLLGNEGSDGKSTLTRHFAAGDYFHLVSSFGYPADSSTDNNSEIKARGHIALGTMAGYVGVAQSADGDNVQIKYAGTYTIKLSYVGTNGITWEVYVEDVDVTSVSIESDNGSTLQVGGTTSFKLTLTAKPDELKTTYSQQFLNPEDIEWKVDDDHKDVVSLEVATNGESATVTLCEFLGEEEDHATITCTVKGFEKTFDVTILPEGAKETPVTEIIFDDTSEVILVDVSNMALNQWFYDITAHVNEDASTQGVTFSIKQNSTVNGVSGTVAYDINEGKITARMFGTVTIVATSVGVDENGSPVTAEKKVRFYSPTFYMNIDWDTNHKSNPSTVQADSNYSVFEWTDITLTANAPVVFLYEGLSESDQWTSTIRSNSYWSGGTTNMGGASGANGNFAVKQSGIYSVKIELDRYRPFVTFTKTGDIVAEESLKVTVSILKAGSQWSNSGSTDAAKVKANLIKDGTATFEASAETRTITITVTGDDFTTKAYPNIQFYVLAGTKGTYYSDEATGVTLSGSKYAASSSGSKWCKSKGCHMWYQGTVSASTSFTFLFTFDAVGSLQSVVIS